MNQSENQIMPPLVALEVTHSGHRICKIPTFILCQMLRNLGVPYLNTFFNALKHAPDDVVISKHHVKHDDCLAFLLKEIPWEMLEAQLSCPLFLRDEIGVLWKSGKTTQGALSIRLRGVSFRKIVYRYFRFRHDWAEQLLGKGELFMPSPAFFNDPFDCGLEESVRLKFIEAAMGCFSTERDNVLMFSHYAENHTGFVVGFDTRLLVASLEANNHPWDASIRPVWYLKKAPVLSLQTEPALCATCKSDVWKYENEFRLFMSQGSDQLASSGSFQFDRNAIREVIIGSKATGQTISACKRHTNDLENCKRYKAYQQPNSFALRFHEIL